MSDVAEFKRNLEEGSRKFAEIADATLKNTHKPVNTPQLTVANIGGPRVKIKPPFCLYLGVCDLKKTRKVYYDYFGKHKRCYQLCASEEGCNQQTEKVVYYNIPK